MMTRRFIRGAAWAAMAVAASAASGCATYTGSCGVVGQGRDLRALEEIQNRTGAAYLVLQGETVYVCSCDGVCFGGGTEGRGVAGATEAHATGGQTEGTATGGETEGTATGGQTEGTATGGQTEGTATGGQIEGTATGGQIEGVGVGGAVEERAVAGRTEGPACQEDRECGGYRVTSRAPLEFFDGLAILPAADNCIPGSN